MAVQGELWAQGEEEAPSLLWGQSEYFMSNLLSGARTLSRESICQSATQAKEPGWAS